jgi:hypothetical protein
MTELVVVDVHKQGLAAAGGVPERFLLSRFLYKVLSGWPAPDGC